MSLVRVQDRFALQRKRPEDEGTILLIEDSVAVAVLLIARIEAETDFRVHWFKTLHEARERLDRLDPELAITCHELPDAPNGEALSLLIEKHIPTIVFTAMLDRQAHELLARSCVIDYFLKDCADAIDDVVRLVGQVMRNRSIPILVVDDKKSARAPLIDMLRRQNYQTFEASSGAEALALIKAHDTIELVITDYQMPDMDGRQLTQHIRRMRAPDRIRVIGISASTDPYLSASFLKAGACDFIFRPFIAEEVQCRINANLDTLSQIQRLRYLAERDPLTGLFNRRAFFESAHVRLSEMRRQALPGCSAILDIDHFKAVNDTYGHDVGDAVIREVAEVLDQISEREKFLTARFGGEEFVMMFSNVDIERAEALCEEVRQTIGARSVPHESTTISVTVSIGLARIHGSEDIDNNLNAADQMLYMAKGSGRNQVFSDKIFS